MGERSSINLECSDLFDMMDLSKGDGPSLAEAVELSAAGTESHALEAQSA